MPERAHSRERTDSSTSSAMDSSVDLDRSSSCESISIRDSERTMSVESLNTLLSKLPEISIPATLYNPLPLQCIAANALPDNLKAEIDGVIAEYTDCSSCSPAQPDNNHSTTTVVAETTTVGEQSTTDVEKNVDSLTTALRKALGIEEVFVSPPSVNKHVGPVHKKTIGRETEDEASTGFGLKMCGGVRCGNCNDLHAIVTGVSPSLYEAQDIIEGVCVVDWNGQLLEGCTHEEVQRIVNATDPSVSNIEISVKNCSENLLIGHGAFDWLPSFAAVHLNKRRNAVFEYKMELDSKSTLSDDSSSPPTIPSSPSRPVPRTRERLELRLLDSSATNQQSRSPSPSEPKKPLTVTIPNADETTQALLASMDAAPKSPKLNSLVNMMPNGMVQLSIDYNMDYEELKISLLQVKGQLNKEFSDPSDVFINTYLVPDRRGQGVRSIMTTHVLKDCTEFHNTSYIVTPDEIPSVALRVILWDAHKPKNIMFRGEVLLGLSDKQFVNLVSEPTWYTLCPEDPNLSKLPPPIQAKSKNGTIFRKIKHSLTTAKTPPRSLSSELRSTSMLSLSGNIEKRSMTLLRKKQRKDTRKTHSGSFIPQQVDGIEEPEVKLKSCLKEPCRQQKLSSILNVLREDLADDNEYRIKEESKSCNDNSNDRNTPKDHSDGNHPRENDPANKGALDFKLNNSVSSIPVPRPRKKLTPIPHPVKRKSLPCTHDHSKITFMEELEKLMVQENFGLRHISERKNTESLKKQLHYKLVDGFQSEDELDGPGKLMEKSNPYQSAKSNDCFKYPAEVSLHRINVEDVDKKDEAKKKSCTLPNERSPQSRPKTLLPEQTRFDKTPPKPPKTYRSKSLGDIEQLGSEEELFLVRSHHMPSSVPTGQGAYNKTLGGKKEDKFVAELVPLNGSTDGASSLDFGGNRFGSCDFLNNVDRTVDRRPMVVEIEEEAQNTKKSKWKSLEDILGSKPKKSKEKKHKADPESSIRTITRSNSEYGANTPDCNVKLEFQFNDLNPVHPVLLIKLTDITLPSVKLMSSDLLMKCYVTHMSTGVCVLKDKTTVSLKNNSSCAPLGILQFGTDISNLAVQIQLFGALKRFSRKMIGQISVDLNALGLGESKTFSQWFLLTKPLLVS